MHLPKIFEKINKAAPGPVNTLPAKLSQEISSRFPHTAASPVLTFQKQAQARPVPLLVGVVFSGGQAPGGHNVVTGLFDALKKMHPSSRLIGFLGGPSGILDGRTVELTQENLEPYRNQGGFDLLGSGRTKIETEEQLQQAENTIRKLKIDGLVLIGGDDTNTNAAILAERFLDRSVDCTVVGVPKTIDGDVKNSFVDVPFGFDTASKTYAYTIGSLMRDALSQGKYYFFIKLMGRSASHIALECALQTHPNYTVISEEVKENKKSLQDIVRELADMVCKRAESQKNFGVVLIPEGLLEFLPPENFTSFPPKIQEQLVNDLDPHGNVQVSKIETERLLGALVEQELAKRKDFKGKFNYQPVFLGYEGRSCNPSQFDAAYCYALGYVAAGLLNSRKTGCMCALRNLELPPEKWEPCGVPLVSLMGMEVRKGKNIPVVKKALVDLEGAPFVHFKQSRQDWMYEDNYLYPPAVSYHNFIPPLTLALEKKHE